MIFPSHVSKDCIKIEELQRSWSVSTVPNRSLNSLQTHSFPPQLISWKIGLRSSNIESSEGQRNLCVWVLLLIGSQVRLIVKLQFKNGQMYCQIVPSHLSLSKSHCSACQIAAETVYRNQECRFPFRFLSCLAATNYEWMNEWMSDGNQGYTQAVRCWYSAWWIIWQCGRGPHQDSSDNACPINQGLCHQ